MMFADSIPGFPINLVPLPIQPLVNMHRWNAGSVGRRPDRRGGQPHDDGRCHEVCRQRAGAHGADAAGRADSASHSGVHAGRPALGRPPVREALPPPAFAPAPAPAHPARYAAEPLKQLPGSESEVAALLGGANSMWAYAVHAFAHGRVAASGGDPGGLLQPGNSYCLAHANPRGGVYTQVWLCWEGEALRCRCSMLQGLARRMR